MSGTSADGVDAVVALFENQRFLGLEAMTHLPHPPALMQALIALGQASSPQLRLAELAALDVAVARQFAAAAQAAMASKSLSTQAICAIGSHGQTIFHDPRGQHSSLQIGDPNHIAAITGLPVAADFRRMDIALGGEGAPLVPAFHAAVFGSEEATAVVNIGGISNITLLPGMAGGGVLGFDCGPGNALMDEWAQLHLGTAYDADGQFAAQGEVIPDVLSAFLSEPYFGLAPPKSTGRSLFNLEWAKARAPQALSHYAAQDVQASFCAVTVHAIAACLPDLTRRVLVCGGGAFNTALMRGLAQRLPQAQINSTESAGLGPQWVEAAAFAWLAHQRVHQLPGNLPSVTGASRLAVLGGLYG